MVEEQDSQIGTPTSVPLKHEEPQIDSGDPWGDDLLARQDIATRLTNLVANQEAPLTISLHGQWGTGKTFLLKRWQKTLQEDGYQAIYFNAWEDDFCDDPLLSIVGQLSDYFKASDLKKLALKAAKYAVPLIVENLLGVASATVSLKLNADHQQDQTHPLLDTYLEQKKTKDQLKTQLSKLADHVASQSKHPLVFIIDELDRCRPTFAIELLERVKHIFEIPNMVFVFGINRDELCKSLQSVYGDIEADIYLRRFFDMEFNLPPANSEVFTRQLMKKYALSSLWPADPIHGQLVEFDELIQFAPPLWSYLGLSLRDIDYCVRLIAFLGMSLGPGQLEYSRLLGILIALKLKNPVIHDEFVTGSRRASEVMDYINRNVSTYDEYSTLPHVSEQVEAYLYLTDKRFGISEEEPAPAFEQFHLLQNGRDLTQPEYLSQRSKRASPTKIKRLIELMSRFEQENRFNYGWSFPGDAFTYISSLIALNQDLVRR